MPMCWPAILPQRDGGFVRDPPVLQPPCARPDVITNCGGLSVALLAEAIVGRAEEDRRHPQKWHRLAAMEASQP